MMKRRSAFWLAPLLLSAACAAPAESDGEVDAVVQFVTASTQVTRMTVSFTPAGTNGDLSVSATDPTSFSGIFTVPAGAQTLSVAAYASGALVGTGTASVNVVKGQQVQASLSVLDTTGAPPVPDHSPVITSFVVSTANVLAGSHVPVSATAFDEDGDAIAAAWTASPAGCATFAAPTSLSTTFTAVTVGSCAVTLTVTANGKSDAKTASLQIVAALAGTVVNFASTFQTIDGFGAADIWQGALSDAQADLFFSQTSGIGLSLLRMGIAADGTFLSPFSDGQKAIARGAKVWAAPWSPNPSWKDSASLNSGSLLASHYSDWATSLVGAYNLAKSNGVTLYGISAQNEPDYNTNGAYAMCLYSGPQMRDFIKVLGPKLAALSPRPKLIAAESSLWNDMWSGQDYLDNIQNDSTALSYLDIAATHQYDVYASVPAHALIPGKPLWETEVSTFDGPSTDIGNGISVALWVHNAIVIGGASAWHYWWLISGNNDNEGLENPGGVATKRLYTVGNFSRFVRPGYARIDVSNMPAGISVSAFANPAGGSFAIVAINNAGADTPITFSLNGASVAAVVPWVTSATQNLAQGNSIAVSSGQFTTTLPSQTVTTFAGTAQ